MTTLTIDRVTKGFGGALALDEASLVAHGGEVHAVLGENGAGKSTLMKILAGVYRRGSGAVLLDDQELALGTPRQALADGIGTVHQEFDLLPDLTVAENVFLGSEPRSRTIGPLATRSRRRTLAEAARLVERYGMGDFVSADDRVGTLSIEAQQLVQILKVLVHRPRVVIFDEPSARLSAPSRQRLFDVIRSLRSDGTVVLYVSHHLEEVFELCDTVTVLRNGRVVATEPATDLDAERLSTLMLGAARRPADRPDRRAGPGSGSEAPPALHARVRRDGDHPVSVDLDVRAGEVVGVTGLVGSGKTEALRALADLSPGATDVQVARPDAAPVRSPRRGREIGYVPEDRRRDGLCLDASVRDNIVLGFLGDHRRAGVVDHAAATRVAESLRRRVHLVCESLDQPVWQLSGGNQQKVLLARWLGSDASVIVLEAPTTGVDVGAKDEIHDLVLALADEGRAIVVSSEDTLELQTLCDRVLLVEHGRVSREWSHDAFDHRALVAALMGDAEAHPGGAA